MAATHTFVHKASLIIINTGRHINYSHTSSQQNNSASLIIYSAWIVRKHANNNFYHYPRHLFATREIGSVILKMPDVTAFDYLCYRSLLQKTIIQLTIYENVTDVTGVAPKKILKGDGMKIKKRGM